MPDRTKPASRRPQAGVVRPVGQSSSRSAGRRAKPAGRPRSRVQRAQVIFAVLGILVILALVFSAFLTDFRFGLGGGQATDTIPTPVGSNLVPTYEARLRDNPNDVNTMVVLANVLQNQGDYPSAINWYEKAVNLKPDDLDIRLAFGQALEAYAQDYDAEAQYQKAIAIDPKSAEAEFYLGQLYDRWNPPRPEDARIHYNRASELEPEGSWGQAARDALARLNATPTPKP